MIAFEAVGELNLSSSTPLAQYGVAFQTVFSLFNIKWPLSGEYAWDLIITGWNKEGGGGRRARSEEVLLETSANRARSKTSLHRK